MAVRKMESSSRRDGLRPLRMRRGFTKAAAGSVLIEMGRTRVLCTASVAAEAPRWRQQSGLGWMTAEYNMLPGATSPRHPRPRFGVTDGRGTEIQRLIGRVLRASLDCDVLDADGGTRTAAINGGFVAMYDALRWAKKNRLIGEMPVKTLVGAVSVGLVEGKMVLDLDYEQDSQADVDMNVAMTETGEFVEIQGTGEQTTFSRVQLDGMLELAGRGIRRIIGEQRRALRLK
jgi:ribonuclease PH